MDFFKGKTFSLHISYMRKFESHCTDAGRVHLAMTFRSWTCLACWITWTRKIKFMLGDMRRSQAAHSGTCLESWETEAWGTAEPRRSTARCHLKKELWSNCVCVCFSTILSFFFTILTVLILSLCFNLVFPLIPFSLPPPSLSENRVKEQWVWRQTTLHLG